MKNNFLLTCCAAFFLLLTSCGGSSESISVDEAGKQNEKLLETMDKPVVAGWFVAEMTSSNMLEAELGRLASSKATNPQVRDLGQLLLNHHNQLNTQMKQIADLKNLVTPTKLQEDHQKIYNQIMEDPGSNFDQVYLATILKNHDQMVERFTDLAERGTDTELRNYAAKALPTLRAHVTSAQELQDQIGK